MDTLVLFWDVWVIFTPIHAKELLIHHIQSFWLVNLNPLTYPHKNWGVIKGLLTIGFP